MKIFKGLMLALAFLQLTTVNVSAQKEDWGEDSLKCRECLSLYGEPLNHKNYAEARKHWKCVVTVCPKIKESVYINGAIIYRHFIDEEKDAAKKGVLIDSLKWIYEKRIEYFGRNIDVLESYGNDMLRYRQEKPEVAYSILKPAIDEYKDQSTAIMIMRYYQACYLMYRQKAKEVTMETMTEEYFRMNDFLDQYEKAKSSDPNIPIARETLGKYGEPFLKCEQIYEIAGKKFNEFPKDPADARLAEMKRLLNILNKKNCSENPVYEKITEEVHKADPSHESAYSLGVVKLNAKKYSEASNYFKEALELCNGCDKEGDYLMGTAKANLVMGNSASAASYARQAMAKDSKLTGQAYVIVAKAIVASQCGESEYARKALYILGVNYLKKAKAADPGLDEINGLIGVYHAHFPEKVDLFDHSQKAGDVVHIGCWINEDVVLEEK